MLDEKTFQQNWKLMKNEVEEWITFYKDVAVSPTWYIKLVLPC